MSDSLLELTVNGELTSVPPGTLLDLLAALDRKPELVAIEHNGRVVPRAEFAASELAAGDRIEIVQFVQGG